MKLVYDEQLIVERAEDNKYIVYSPLNHRWMKVNQYMHDLVQIILRDNGTIDFDKVIDFFRKQYQIELTTPIVKEQIEKLTDSEVFFENKEDLLEAKDKKMRSKENFAYPKIKQAYLHPTLRCNFTCSYCYNKDITADASVELNTSLWIEIIEKLKDQGVSKFVFTGGEPLLNGDLEKIIQATKTENIEFIMITNGSLLKDRFDSLVPLLDKVCISLDSFDERINRLNRSDVNFKQINETIQLFARSAPQKLKIKTVITKNNYRQAQDFYSQLQKNYGIECQPTWFIPRQVEEIDQIPDFDLELIRKNYDKRFFKMHLIRCGACYSIIAVDPKGDLYPCQSLLFDRFKMGNILDDNWYEKYVNSKIRDEFLQSTVNEMEKCSVCSYRYFCGGGCPAISYRIYGEVASHLDFLCDFLKDIAKDVLINAQVQWDDIS